ncbi:MAG: helix-turn-helix domain-containing protein [Rhodobacteraceae bacterium]|nr:helix-turn-helix domain-containing protein [Paracoccaceae bacterium]
MSQAGLAARAAGRASRNALTGTRIRERRTVMGIRQADLARTVGISPSYLNLIEHNRRRIGGKLLVDLAAALGVDVSALTHGAESELLDQLSEAAVADAEIAAEMERVEEFVGRFPGWAQLIAHQRRQMARLQRQVDAMADRLSHDPALSGVLHDLLSKVTAIQSTATILAETGDLDREWQDKFIANLSDDSRDLAARSASLVGYLDGSADSELTLASPQEDLEAYLGRTGFHIAELEEGGDGLDAALEAAAPALGSQAAHALAAAHFRRYRADAERMPLRPLRALVAEKGPDPAAVASAFSADLDAAMRRLAAIPPEPGAPAAGLVICDGSGALLLRKPTEGFLIPRFGTGCVYWPLYQALGQPGRAICEPVMQPGAADRSCIAYAVCTPVPPLVFDTHQTLQATMLVVPETLARDPAPAPPVDVGASCSTCPAEACAARREASVLRGVF